MQFKPVKLATHWGEIEIRVNESGETACPVCGYELGGDWPWGLCWNVDDIGNPIGEPIACGSFDICPCCSCHYGNDDHPTNGKTVPEEWERLRKEWLSQTAITPEIEQQLANLDLDVDGLTSPQT